MAAAIVAGRRSHQSFRTTDARRRDINLKKRAVRGPLCCSREQRRPNAGPRGAAAQEEDRINELFKKHDTNQSESLHDAQLKAFMQEYVKLLPGMEEKRVADAEVK